MNDSEGEVVEQINGLMTITDAVNNYHLNYVLNGDEVFFRAKDVATLLGYADTSQAIRVNVDDDDKKQLKELVSVSHTPMDYQTGITIFINESGLYSLILKSQKEEAKVFKRWVTKDVLPSIRKHGSYAISDSTSRRLHHNQFKMLDEYDLHTKVIEFIREYIPDMIVVPSLGELQSDQKIRSMCYKKGYRGGQPDILILNKHRNYNGLAIELKTPKGNGKFSDNQKKFLEDLHRNNFQVVTSDKYEEVIMALTEYKSGFTIFDESSGKHFKSKGQLTKYNRMKAQALQQGDSEDGNDNEI